ncbi:STAS domain-containing protein [Edaphobacter bradus]|uniref:STAS domain-containing protein n=1 Tax=Edaphobacter bradus TaxID=2259016 RepID=UPI0021E039B2|nr:STAS domain-containing protein [Edaphobacter bradus]
MSDTGFSYSTSEGTKPGTAILKLAGPLTLANIFGLQDELRKVKPECLIMDLTGVPFMDSAGLGVVMNYYVSSQKDGRKLFLTGVNDRVSALLEMTKVDGVLKVCGSLEAAEALA